MLLSEPDDAADLASLAPDGNGHEIEGAKIVAHGGR
jgi:hypothetical protein